MARHNELGKAGEDFAASYLEHAGYGIIERDWRQGSRDIDIVARTEDGTTVVFVEVKTRSSDAIVRPKTLLMHARYATLAVLPMPM